MRLFLLAGASLLALSAAGPVSAMPTTTFAYTGGFQSYTVPTTGLYDIVAIGAQGGGLLAQQNNPPYGQVAFAGGLGAEIGGDFELTAGEMLSIAVGGGGSGGSGGGGSFVVGPGSTPLVIAGGGGGSGVAASGAVSGPYQGGGNAQTGTAGASGSAVYGYGSSGGVGGVGGSGGGAGNYFNGYSSIGAAGGGGFYGNGSSAFEITGSEPARVVLGGGAFPSLSGYGGGGYGGGGGLGPLSGGGGGGYSGGGGAGAGPGGGGGSFDDGLVNADRILTLGPGSTDLSQSNNGTVMITELSAATSVPEPSSLLLFGVGLAGLLGLRRCLYSS